jgi:hypothetical protein
MHLVRLLEWNQFLLKDRCFCVSDSSLARVGGFEIANPRPDLATGPPVEYAFVAATAANAAKPLKALRI